MFHAAKKVYDLFKDRTDRFPPGVRDLLGRIGGKAVVSIDVCREPVNANIVRVLDTISLGNFTRNSKTLGYDNVFHLFMKITLDDGKTYLVEKNQVIKITPFSKSVKEFVPVQVHKPVSLGEMLEKTRKLLGDNDFFVYSPSKNNCQKLVQGFLNANGLLTKEVDSFVMQDAGKLIEGLPSLGQKFAQGVTDLARSIDILVYGRSMYA